MRRLPFLLLTFILFLPVISSAKELPGGKEAASWIAGKQGVERTENGEVDWTQKIIMAVGSAPSSLGPSSPRISPEQLAQKHAWRNLFIIVKRIPIDPGSVLGDFMAKDDQIRLKVEKAIYSSIKQKNTRYLSDGCIEITISCNMSEEFLALMDQLWKSAK
jgi:hypothetical protein